MFIRERPYNDLAPFFVKRYLGALLDTVFFLRQAGIATCPLTETTDLSTCVLLHCLNKYGEGAFLRQNDKGLTLLETVNAEILPVKGHDMPD